MGMTDRQFDSYQARLKKNLEYALEKGKDHESLKKEIEDIVKEIEAELKRP